MAVKHIAVFIILGAAYIAWTMIAKRKDAASKADAETPDPEARSAPGDA